MWLTWVWISRLSSCIDDSISCTNRDPFRIVFPMRFIWKKIMHTTSPTFGRVKSSDIVLTSHLYRFWFAFFFFFYYWIFRHRQIQRSFSFFSPETHRRNKLLSVYSIRLLIRNLFQCFRLQVNIEWTIFKQAVRRRLHAYGYLLVCAASLDSGI